MRAQLSSLIVGTFSSGNVSNIFIWECLYYFHLGISSIISSENVSNMNFHLGMISQIFSSGNVSNIFSNMKPFSRPKPFSRLPITGQIEYCNPQFLSIYKFAATLLSWRLSGPVDLCSSSLFEGMRKWRKCEKSKFGDKASHWFLLEWHAIRLT